MNEVTLEAIRAKQAEVTAMIERIFTIQATNEIVIPEVKVALRQGERYAGAILNANGTLRHHLVLLPDRPGKRLNWANANDWARDVGGALPTRQEQALLYANCKDAFEQDWYWSCEEHANADYAWYQGFDYGRQYCSRKDNGGLAVAVRRLTA